MLGATGGTSGFLCSTDGGADSGSIVILGSVFGGTTAERGSGRVWGRRSIPGSIREGGGALGRSGLSERESGAGAGEGMTSAAHAANKCTHSPTERTITVIMSVRMLSLLCSGTPGCGLVKEEGIDGNGRTLPSTE